ncbi:MAG: hypothetical protein WCR31_02030 [Treponema sp.]
MTRILTVLSAAACTALLLSCSTVKKTEPAAQDSYDSSAVPLPQVVPSSPESGPEIPDGDPYSKEKIRGGKKTFAQQFFGTEKYVKADSSSAFIRNTFGSVQQRPLDLIYKPQTDLAGFMVRYDTTLYCFYMAQADRRMFRDAVNRYLTDFEGQKLIRKYSKTEKIYGEAGSYEEFGMIATMMPNISKPDVRLGYRFLGSSPYFCMKVRKATNIAEDMGTNVVPESIEQCYYFTKAQAQALADFLSDENVAKQAAAYEKDHGAAPQNKDTY